MIGIQYRLTSKNISLYLFYSSLIAGLYYASGILVKPLIVPPTFAAPIWPAAGIGVAVLLLWGNKFIPALVIGEILINLKFYKLEVFSERPEMLITFGVLLLATVLRSVIGAYLVRQNLGKSNDYLTLQSVAKLLILAGLIPTFITSALSTLALSTSGTLQLESVTINFLTWWYGDTVGVFIFLPLMMVFFKKPRVIWKPRLLKTAIPVAVSFVLLIAVSFNIKNLEHKRLLDLMDNQLDVMVNSVFDSYQSEFHLSQQQSNDEIKARINTLFQQKSQEIIQLNQLNNIHFVVKYESVSPVLLLFESANKSSKNISWSASKILEFSGNRWKIEAYATSSFYTEHASWMVWWLLSVGFLFIAFLAAGLLVVTGNTLLVNSKVVDRVNEIKTLNKILSESEERYKQLVEIQPIIFWKYVVGSVKLDFVSNEAVKLLGYPKKDLINFDMIWNRLLYHKDRSRVIKEFYQGLKNQTRFTLKYRALNKEGQLLWFKDYISSQKVNGKIEVVGLKIDITKEQVSQDRIKQLAYYDTMTRLPNRVKFMEILTKEIKVAVQHGSYGAVLYLDLDRFKVLNDSMGHYFGDKLLVQIGQRLKETLRKQDVSSRFGGDEFVILLKSVAGKSYDQTCYKVHKVAKKVQEAINKPFNIDGYEFYSSFSTGITIFPENSDNADIIIQQADIAMYHSKSKGKNAISFFKKEMQESANKRLEVEKSLKNALVRKEFVMYYQPIFDDSKKVIMLEALIRWNHPTQGVIMPNQFIRIAEETRFINELSEWIIDDVFNHVALNRGENNIVLPISINISLFQFNNTQLVQILESASDKYSVDCSMITLELTETIGIDNFDDALTKLYRLKELGFRIAIDDFGTGYSSLNYLTQMPIDILKLDKSFTNDIGIKSSSETLIETIVLMAQKLDLDITVEGVETDEQFEFLKQLGCTAFQGFLFSEALPLHRIIGVSDQV